MRTVQTARASIGMECFLKWSKSMHSRRKTIHTQKNGEIGSRDISVLVKKKK
jgi:hypothetical protein